MVLKFTVGALTLFEDVSNVKKAKAEGERLIKVVDRKILDSGGDGAQINLVVDMTKVAWSNHAIRTFYKTYFIPSSNRVHKGTLKIFDDDLHKIFMGNTSFRIEMLGPSGTSTYTFSREDVARDEASDDEGSIGSAQSDSDIEIDYQETQQDV